MIFSRYPKTYVLKTTVLPILQYFWPAPNFLSVVRGTQPLSRLFSRSGASPSAIFPSFHPHRKASSAASPIAVDVVALTPLPSPPTPCTAKRVCFSPSPCYCCARPLPPKSPSFPWLPPSSSVGRDSLPFLLSSVGRDSLPFL
jgi:hypothetical protein